MSRESRRDGTRFPLGSLTSIEGFSQADYNSAPPLSAHPPAFVPSPRDPPRSSTPAPAQTIAALLSECVSKAPARTPQSPHQTCSAPPLSRIVPAATHALKLTPPPGDSIPEAPGPQETRTALLPRR